VIGAAWPVVGRTEQIADVAARLTARGEPGVLLTGEPGVGKSRLITEVLDRCARDGVYVLRVAGAEASSGLPFQAMSGLLTREPGAELFATVGRFLHRDAGQRPVVLGVDDANHLDPASAAVVQHLGVTSRATLLVAARAGALGSATVRGLRRLVSEVVVRGLDRDQVGELLQAVLGGPVDGLSLDRLCRLTRGNPLFLRHLVEAGRVSGALRASAGVWGWHGRLRGYERLADLVEASLRGLDEHQRQALRWVAHGEPLPLTALERLAEAELLEELERRSLIEAESRGGRLLVRIGHPLYGEVVRSGTTGQRRRAVYRDLADAFAATGDGGEDRLRTVSCRLLADDPVAEDDVLAAAAEAMVLRDPALAERLARTVPAGRDLLAEALVVQGKAEEAERCLVRLDRPALRALNLFWGLRKTREAVAVVRDAQAGSPELRVAELALATFGDGGCTNIELPDLPPGSAVAGASSLLRAYLLTFVGRPGAVVADVESGALPLAGPWPAMGGATRACYLHALVLAGRLTEALVLAPSCYRDAVEQGAHDEAALLSFQWGVCETWAGHHRRALPHYREARALIDEHTPFPVRAYVFGEYAAGLAATGDVAAGWRVLAEGERSLPPDSTMRDHLVLGRIRILACSGRFTTAADEAVELAELYLNRGRPANAVEALYYAARISPSRQVAARLETVVSTCDSELFPVLARHARAVAAGDVESLGEVSEVLESLGYHGMAAEAAAAASAGAGGREAVRQARREAGLRELCGGFRAKWSAPAVPVEPLTRRQREICVLAADGMETAAIAARLTISIRTVANHLHAAYAKLGVQSRDELGSALSRLDRHRPGSGASSPGRAAPLAGPRPAGRGL